MTFNHSILISRLSGNEYSEIRYRYRRSSSHICEREYRFRSRRSDICKREYRFRSRSSDICKRDYRFRSRRSDICKREYRFRSRRSDIRKREYRFRGSRNQHLISNVDFSSQHTPACSFSAERTPNPHCILLISNQQQAVDGSQFLFGVGTLAYTDRSLTHPIQTCV